MPSPGIILQARFSSTRLPGKALASLAGLTLLEHCLVRLRAGNAATVVLATTTGAEDDALAAAAERLGVAVFRGDAEDVLGRYVAAARRFDLDPVIRATGDNPAVDVDAATRVLDILRETGADYACEAGLPVGAAVEGITFAALARADRLADRAEDREHVTTLVKRELRMFRTASRPAPASLRRPGLRLTVDTAEDLTRVRLLFKRTGSPMPSLRQLVEAAASTRSREVA